MKTFVDSNGTAWLVSVNVSTIRRVKAIANVNLLDAVNGQLMNDLMADPMMLADVLWSICEPQATTKNVTAEAFGELLAGDTIDKATEALLTELVDFFPQPKREILAAALRKSHEIWTKAATMATERINNVNTDKILASLPTN